MPRKKQAGNASLAGFVSSQDVEEYFRAEKNKIDMFIQEMNKEKIRSYLDISKKKLIALYGQRKKLDYLERDLKDHLKKVNIKLSELNKKKKKQMMEKRKVGLLKKSFKKLGDRAKDIQDTRKDLIQKEKDLIKGMKTLANEHDLELSVTGLQDSRRIKEIENTKEHILLDAITNLKDEISLNPADHHVMSKMNEKMTMKIKALNQEMDKLRISRKKLTARLHLVDGSEEKVKAEIDRTHELQKKYEGQYKKMLGKIRVDIKKKPKKKKVVKKRKKTQKRKSDIERLLS